MKNHEKALAALLTSDTQAEAAKKAGISDRTLREYLTDPAFAGEYNRRKRQMVTDATRQLQASYQSAIRALRRITESEISADAATIAAARAILEYGQKFTETNDILVRIEEVEKKIEKDR